MSKEYTMAPQPKRILVAEDESSLRDFISRNLHVRGFEVVEANNGLEALALWETEQPDLLILDIMMPRTGGAAPLAVVGPDPDGRGAALWQSGDRPGRACCAPGRRGSAPDADRVRITRTAGEQCRQSVDASHAALARLGQRVRRRIRVSTGVHGPATPQTRARPRQPAPLYDRARRRLSLRALTRLQIADLS